MRTLWIINSKSAPILLASFMAAGLFTRFAGGAEAHDDQADEGSDNHSKTVLAFDADFVASIREPGADIGGGGAVRLGRKLELVLVSLTPEIGGGYYRFKGSNDTRIYHGFVGGRLGLGKIVEPSAFAHFGVGRLEANLDSHTALALDAGIALDLTFLPLINLGAHASYSALLPRGSYSSFDWLLFGLHVAVVF